MVKSAFEMLKIVLKWIRTGSEWHSTPRIGLVDPHNIITASEEGILVVPLFVTIA